MESFFLPDLRFRHHHYNPHTGDGGKWWGQDAVYYATGLWGEMEGLFGDPTNRWKEDGDGSLHTLGRILHLLQDMAAPPHVHARDGHGWALKGGPYQEPLFLWLDKGYYSDFEETWSPSSGAHQNWLFPPSAEDDPLKPDTTIFQWSSVDDIPNSYLDDKSFEEMHSRLWTVSHETIKKYMETQAWISYFHSSFYGKIQKCEETPMPAYIGGRESVLAIMFDEERLEFHNGENDAFWEIVGVGHYEKDNTHFPDDWWPCPGSYPEGSKEVNGGSAKMGRFYIYLHYYQEDEEGNIDGMDFSVADPPDNWPNGDANNSTSLAKYYGDVLLPLSTRFGAGLLEEVFPAPKSLEYPIPPDITGWHYLVEWEMPDMPSEGSLTGARVERSKDEGVFWEEGDGEVFNETLYLEVWPTDETELEAGESYRYKVRAKWFEDKPDEDHEPILGLEKTGDLDYKVSAPPFITKMKVRQDSTDDSEFERLIYEFEHVSEGEYEVGEEFLTNYQINVVGSGESGRKLRVKIVFSESMAIEELFWITFWPHSEETIDFESLQWSETYVQDDTLTGTMIVPPRKYDGIDSVVADHSKDVIIGVVGKSIDVHGILRFIDHYADGKPNYGYDINHRLKVDTKQDESPEIRIDSIHE